MRVSTFLADGTADDIVSRGGDHLGQTLGTPALIAAFCSTAQPLGVVLDGLKARFPQAVVIGCSTAGEFSELGDRKGHTSLWAISGDLRVHAGFGSGLARDPEATVMAATQTLPVSIDGYPHRTAIILLDALAGVSEETTLLVAGLLGSDVRLAGGAAGDDLQMKAPLVGLSGAGVGSDAVVVVTLHTRVAPGVGVSHGHRTVSGPLTVTKSSGAVVAEVDGRPAFDVWREQTRTVARDRGIDVDALKDEQIGAFLLQVEAGLAAGETIKIRAPLARGDDGSLSFACGIPEGSVVRITEGTEETQVASAVEAARRARAQMGPGRVAGALVFDCICRNLILKERFKDAVAGMHDALGRVPLAGFESYGEVALDVGDYSGFHNTTTVVLAFPAEDGDG